MGTNPELRALFLFAVERLNRTHGSISAAARAAGHSRQKWTQWGIGRYEPDSDIMREVIALADETAQEAKP